MFLGTLGSSAGANERAEDRAAWDQWTAVWIGIFVGVNTCRHRTGPSGLIGSLSSRSLCGYFLASDLSPTVSVREDLFLCDGHREIFGPCLFL